MIGSTISHYRILDKLGEGGMGVVYKAQDLNLDRVVALKILPPDKVADAERKRRFVQEAKSASALNHPNIITVYDIGTEGETAFIAMEYVPGRTLKRLISAEAPLDPVRAIDITTEILKAVRFAHRRGVLEPRLQDDGRRGRLAKQPAVAGQPALSVGIAEVVIYLVQGAQQWAVRHHRRPGRQSLVHGGHRQ